MLVLGIFCLLLFVQESCSEILVSEEKYTWRDAMEFCANRSARLVSSDTAMQTYLNSSDVTWNSNTITLDIPCREVSKTRLCGFTFNSHNIGYRKGFTLFGDCNATHFHACKSPVEVPFYVTNCTYDEAMKCNYTLTALELPWLDTGYYWTKRTFSYCTQQAIGMLDVATERFCGVYGEDFGNAFGNCSEMFFALCTSDTSNAVTGEIGNDTFTRQFHPTHIPEKHQPTTLVSGNDTFTRQFHSTQISGKPTTHTSNAVTGDRRNATFTSQVLPTQIPGKHQPSTRNVTFTRQVLPTQMPEKQQPTTHLSMKIGVPVGVCLVLVCGVILVILYVRRRRRKHKRREPKYLDTNKTEKRNSMRRTRVNNTYELHTSVIVSQTESDQAVGKTVQVDHNYPQRQSETNSDYDFVEETEADCMSRKHEYGDTSSNVRNKELNSSDELVDNTDYCFAKEVDNQTSNEGKDPDYHIYNSANEDNGQYDAVTTKRQEEIKPNNVYNHVSYRSDRESDYDSTIPGKQLKHQETDNVYNSFSGDGVDESNEYDFTGSMSDTTEAEIEDNTYNTLNLK